jgi:hypothetical protein
VAFVPRTVAGVPVRSGSAWQRFDKAKRHVIVEARVEAIDAAAASKLVLDAHAVLGGVDRAPEKCRAKLRDVASAVAIERDGTIVSARAELAPSDLSELLGCL